MASANGSQKSTTPKAQPTAHTKPTIVGVYGLPGAGKSFLLKQLKEDVEELHGKLHFTFFEGSEAIDRAYPGGLNVFKKLGESQKLIWRKGAIDMIGNECAISGKIGIVAGHFMFWSDGEEDGMRVFTDNDASTYTHIIYLSIPVEIIADRRLKDVERSRPPVSLNHLRQWQMAERNEIRELCHKHGILYIELKQETTVLDQMVLLLEDIRLHDEQLNMTMAEAALDTIMEDMVKHASQLQTMLVLDADRTLAPIDTGASYWQMSDMLNGENIHNRGDPLKNLFSGPLGYSYEAFRQAAWLYDSDSSFEHICREVASNVAMYPEFISLLKLVEERRDMGVVIISCGLGQIWQEVLDKEDLTQAAHIIGGGRLADFLIVTPEFKTAMVSRLQNFHKLRVCAFGDSVLDLPMLRQADRAIVVVGEEDIRSKSMDAALLDAIDNKGLKARQVLLPSSVSPRLSTDKLPLVDLSDPNFLTSVFIRQPSGGRIGFLHATDRPAAKLLMTPMRDAKIAGTALREAHRRVGWYLAIEYLTQLTDLEEFTIPHVQGHDTKGYSIPRATIVALMRGGEPMALGVSDAIPLAMFVHANRPDDIKPHHLEGPNAVVLVDSVVNSGKTMIAFMKHVRSLDNDISIIIVTGVIQAKAVDLLLEMNSQLQPIHIVALRMSDNKFTGTGTTDTGNRLFNTTHLK